MDEPPPPPPPSTLRRRNSLSNPVLVPTKLALPTTKPFHTSSRLPNGSTSSHTPLDLKLISLKSPPFAAYTSLKDLIPSATVNSPTAATPTPNSGYEISIRNRLVKQAAWAYLQPMSSSQHESGPGFLRRLWLRLSSHNPLSCCFQFIHIHLLPCLLRVFDRLLSVLGIHIAR